ncbi:MAG TPA: penicillin-binding protein [Chitinophagaceae bacterium]|nr:MAG: peptidoglycan glycosyltransferase [Bacteroidetes bacterium OLB11]HMN31746.1 penicillin-binding protein [Chitinophagaceae bacterium]
MKDKINIKLRVYITFLLMCLFGVLIIYKAASIQIKEGKTLLSQADSMTIKIDTMQPERGNIYSEDGCLLSTSIPQFDLRVDFKSIPNDTFNKYVESLSKGLETIFKDKNWKEYKNLLTTAFNQQNRYFLLKRKVSYANLFEVKKLQPFAKNQNKGGLIVEPKTKRIYPYGLLANRVIGISRENGNGVGIENQYDSLLKGKPGQRIVRKLAGGTWMPIEDSEVDPENGADIHSTIDLQIQDVVENALYNQVEKEQVEFGTCIVMEVKTGKIKALANLGRQPDGSYAENDNYALKLLEPGSTFKLTSLISLMRDKIATIDDKVNCQGGSIKFGKNNISDAHKGLGVLTIRDAFAHSSNVAFAKLIYENYKDKVGSYWTNLHDLGLDQPTGINLIKREPRSYFKRDSAKNGKFGLASMGIGYSIVITPLHTCMVYNAIANNGKIMKPYIVNSANEYGKEIVKYEPTVVKDLQMDSTSIEKIKDALQAVVEIGTGKALKNPYYTICGKTGTSKVVDVVEKVLPDGSIVKEKISYSDKVYNASFVGFFPKEDPQYTICVILRTQKGATNIYGGQLALPVFKEVANRLYAINTHNVNSIAKHKKVKNNFDFKNIKGTQYNILNARLKFDTKMIQENSIVMSKDTNGNILSKIGEIQLSKVPNVEGMGLRDAIYLLEKSGLKVHSTGKGKVVSQSIEPGSNIQKGNKIILQLS